VICASVLTVETVDEHLSVRLKDDEEEVRNVVEAVPCKIKLHFVGFLKVP
jgi:hypothetical protein